MSATQQPKRYQPTYRLESKCPYNRKECEKLMKDIVDTTMEPFIYDSMEAETLSKQLSEAILTNVKNLNFDRYKLVCVVTIGERYMQSFCDMFRCLWDKQKDGFAFYVYDNPTAFTIAALYAIYFD